MMQVHLALLLMVIVCLATTMESPFGGKYAWLLLNLEVLTLGSTFAVLWAGSVFSTYPQCLDPNGNGTLWWCDALSIIVGIFVFVCMIILVGAFIYINIHEARANKEITFDTTSKGVHVYTNPMEKSLELIEMKQKQHEKTRKQIQRLRRARSSLTKNSRITSANSANNASSSISDPIPRTVEITYGIGEVLIDEESGKRYSVNRMTGESVWLDDDDDSQDAQDDVNIEILKK